MTPSNLLFAARFAATKYEDCGTCLQIVVNQAIDDKVNSAIVAAMVAGDNDLLDSETRLAAEFARAVRSRAIKFQPYFESGLPYGHDQWISVAATMALIPAVD